MKTLKTRKGFTLIEIVTVIVVLGILGAFTLTFIDNAIKTYMIASKQGNLFREASYIMERITRELRDMVNPPSWNNGQTFNTLELYKIHGTPQDSNTNITFRRDPSTNIFYRDSGGISRAIGKSVMQFIVDRSSTSSCDRSIAVTLTLQDGDQSFTVNSRVTPKNLGTDSFTDRCFNGDYEDFIQ